MQKDDFVMIKGMENGGILDINVLPVSGRIGAELPDIVLSSDLTEEMVDALKILIVKYKVLFFRDQDHLDDAEQERFAARLGKLASHPTRKSAAEGSDLLKFDSTLGGNRADSWHTDQTFIPAYPKFCVLRGVAIPSVGGDTIWANTAAAYDSLPEPLKLLAENLWAVHSNDYGLVGERPNVTASDVKSYERLIARIYETEHPVVRVHPETGERSLVLGNFVQRLVGLTKRETTYLYEIFQSYVTLPENTVRWRWRKGDVAIWDNRSTQHWGVYDYGDHYRAVHRASVAGEEPVSVDGRRSMSRVSASPSVG